MAILNYTTKVPIERTVAEMQERLRKAGARSVMVEYHDDRTPAALSFSIETPVGERSYRLPARAGAVFSRLTQAWRDGDIERRYVSEAQGHRVGWRILKDWIEAQLALIEVGMVALHEVLLPYQLTESGQTVFEIMTARRLELAPTAEPKQITEGQTT